MNLNIKKNTTVLSENEIKKNWISDQVLVSICCIAYNHELYIKNALDGFLNQKTNFPFEILIHDDASTDKTANIISEYQKKYPSIVKPILQKINQHSKGISILRTFNFPRAKGEFIALCEGDDYWIDPNKLQKQIDALKRYPKCSICFHSAFALNREGKKYPINVIDKNETLLDFKDVIFNGGGGMPTASIVFRTSIIETINKFYSIAKPCGVGDSVYQIISSEVGGALYLPFQGSIYRKDAIGSWSEKMNKDKAFAIKTRVGVIDLYIALNNFYDKKYDSYFHTKIGRICLKFITDSYIHPKFNKSLYEKYKEYLNDYSLLYIKILYYLRTIKKNIRRLIYLMR
ncbi:MAG: glycosyltransferase [Sphaerochaetaceae bacterium]|nr:glycosyltransferase [Sphaerochaetaceae bacterium]